MTYDESAKERKRAYYLANREEKITKRREYYRANQSMELIRQRLYRDRRRARIAIIEQPKAS